MTKEEFYDAEISPLMDKIIGLCKARGIAMLAAFHLPDGLQGTLLATTFLHDGDGRVPENLAVAKEVILGTAEVQIFSFSELRERASESRRRRGPLH